MKIYFWSGVRSFSRRFRRGISTLACFVVLALVGCQPSPNSNLTPRTEATPSATIRIPAKPLSTKTRAVPPATTTSPPATPTRIIYLPTPTVIRDLVERQTEAPGAQPPDGLVMDIYKMRRNPFPEELGYNEILRSLGNQSRISRLPQGRYYWDTADLARMETDNAALAPFGYRIASKAVEEQGARWFELYQGEKLILDPIMQLGTVSVNQSGSDFMLLVGTNGLKLVQKASITDWKYTTSPQYLGDDPMHVETKPENLSTPSKTPEPQGRIAEVYRGRQVIYKIHYQDRVAATGFIGFWTYQQHWALEVVDRIVIDGQEANTQNGFDKSYEFHLLGATPFFFFEKAGQSGISFAGEEINLPFQKIPHYGCCSAGLLNPIQVGNLLLFYGIKDGNWYYIELTESG